MGDGKGRKGSFSGVVVSKINLFQFWILRSGLHREGQCCLNCSFPFGSCYFQYFPTVSCNVSISKWILEDAFQMMTLGSIYSCWDKEMQISPHVTTREPKSMQDKSGSPKGSDYMTTLPKSSARGYQLKVQSVIHMARSWISLADTPPQPRDQGA